MSLLLYLYLVITLGVAYLLCYSLNINFSQRIIVVTALGAASADLIVKTLVNSIIYNYSDKIYLFSYTLLFIAIFFISSAFLYTKKRIWIPFFALGSFIYPISDEIWEQLILLQPLRTFFGLLYGFDFEAISLEHWITSDIYSLLHNPKIYISEIVGLVIFLLILFWRFIPSLYHNSKLLPISGSTEKNWNRVSLVVPTMNESKNIPYVFSRIPEIVDEIIVVDSSSDNTVEAIKLIQPDAKIYIEDPHGKGSALKKGFEYATGDIVIMIDADGSMDPQEIPLFVKPLIEGYDVVNGSRILGGSDDLSWLRRLGNMYFVTLVNILFDTNYTDLCYGYRGFKKSALEKLKFQSEGFDVETEQSILTKKMGLRSYEVPSYEKKRIFGKSNLKTFGDGMKILMRIFREKMA